MTDHVQRYLGEIPIAREAQFRSLHDLIFELYPRALVDMQYKMPTYHVADNWVALANKKNYLSLYTCDAKDLVTFKKNHQRIKSGKTCINFRESDDIPLDSVAEVITNALGG